MTGGLDGFPAPPPEGLSRRGIALLVGGGLAVVLIAGIALAMLTTGDGKRPRPPAAGRGTPQPVVPEDPATTLGPAATAMRATATVRPSASRTSARPSSAASTTPGPQRVLTVSVTADPNQFASCRGTLTTQITVRMTLSQPGLAVRYTINETLGVHKTATGASFTETTQVTVADNRGEHQVRIAVPQPGTASATTVVLVDCGR